MKRSVNYTVAHIYLVILVNASIMVFVLQYTKHAAHVTCVIKSLPSQGHHLGTLAIKQMVN